MGFFNAIGNAVKAVTNVVTEAASGVADVAKGAVKVATTIVSDTFEIADTLTGGMLGKLSDFMGGSLGTMLNKGLDALGLPDWVGDIAGSALDFCTGNWVGAAANGLDALEDLAKACGGDELAAFLKTGSEVTNMFSPAGAMNLGKAGEIANAASTIIDKIDMGMGALNKLQTGDIIGAGADIFKLAGVDAGEFAESVGKAIDPDLTSMVISCFGQAETAMSYLDDPLKGVKDLMGGPLKEFAPAASSMFDSLTNAFGEIKRAGNSLPANLGPVIGFPMPGVANELFNALKEMAGDRFTGSTLSPAQNMIARALEQALQQLIMCNENRQAFGEIADLLRQAASRLETVDLQCHHGTAIRA